jgi:cell shape-determining protein MreC
MAENQTKLDFVGNFIQSMVEEISSLKNQLATATAENAKDERVAAAEKYASELEAQNKKLRQQFRMGINSDDTEKIHEWWRAHTE